LARKTKQTKSTKKSKPPPRRTKPPPQMVIRRNAAPVRAASAKPAQPKKSERTPIVERMQDMGGGHVAAAIGAGAAGNIIGVIAVGQGWLSPKTSAGLLVGTGAATTAAGYYWESDHVMAAGAGLTAAGTFSLINQYAIDAYEAGEKRAQEKKAERDKKNEAKRIADAHALVEAEKQKERRNARFVVIDGGKTEHPECTD